VNKILAIGGKPMPTAVAPSLRFRSKTKIVSAVLFGLLTVFVIYMKNARVFDPTSEIAQHFAPVKWLLVAHGFFGVLALLLGGFQFSNRLRAKYLKVHRTLGYTYVASVFLSAPLAIPIPSESIPCPWLPPRACSPLGGC
jgi:hypothetical protein